MAKVLIVDDSKFMRDQMAEVIQLSGHEIIGFATNGNEAVAHHNNLSPDLVILDIVMPECSGRDALLQIIDTNPKTKVIMCSTLGSEKIIAECIEEGASGFIIKPYVKEEAVATIKSILT